MQIEITEKQNERFHNKNQLNYYIYQAKRYKSSNNGVQSFV
jgi:hypothetical protein